VRFFVAIADSDWIFYFGYRSQPLRNGEMFLDKSRIPFEKLDDPRLKENEKEVLEAMQNPTYRLHVCLHEAAHGVYLQ
jgi:hypothetical protein